MEPLTFNEYFQYQKAVESVCTLAQQPAHNIAIDQSGERFVPRCRTSLRAHFHYIIECIGNIFSKSIARENRERTTAIKSLLERHIQVIKAAEKKMQGELNNYSMRTMQLHQRVYEIFQGWNRRQRRPATWLDRINEWIGYSLRDQKLIIPELTQEQEESIRLKADNHLCLEYGMQGTDFGTARFDPDKVPEAVQHRLQLRRELQESKQLAQQGKILNRKLLTRLTCTIGVEGGLQGLDFLNPGEELERLPHVNLTPDIAEDYLELLASLNMKWNGSAYQYESVDLDAYYFADLLEKVVADNDTVTVARFTDLIQAIFTYFPKLNNYDGSFSDAAKKFFEKNQVSQQERQTLLDYDGSFSDAAEKFFEKNQVSRQERQTLLDIVKSYSEETNQA